MNESSITININEFSLLDFEEENKLILDQVYFY